MTAFPIVHTPFWLSVGPWRVSGFGIALACAAFLVHAVLRRELWSLWRTPELATGLLVWIGGGFILGAKVSAVLTARSIAAARAPSGGAFWSAAFGAAVAAALWAGRRRLPLAPVGDALALAAAAAYPVGRTGCWAVGDDYGRPWDGPLAVAFPHGAPPSTAANLAERFGVALPPGVPPDAVMAVHPTQLYEVVLGVGVFLLVWRYRARDPSAGAVTALYAMLAGAERFGIDFLRAKDDRVLGPFTVTQLGAAALAVGGALAWTRVVRGAR